MRRLLAICIGSLVSALALAAPIEIMVEDAAAPMSNPDGSGYANEIVLAAFAAMDTPVKLTVVPYARCKKYVLSGAVAACLSMSDAPELAGKVRLSGLPLFYAYPRFYYHTSRPVAARTLAELPAGLRVGIVNGYEYPPEILRLTERGIHLLQARSEETNLKKLAVGHIDLVVSMMDDFKTDDALISKAGVQQVVFAFETTPQGSYIGFSSLHPQGEQARQLFNRGYAAIVLNGTRAAIERKWKNTRPLS
ncbi:substrate-binding periplasmic protein [Pseudoduganella danionis]|nr:transporter substrate-binding domain-containing protein [Pseudoduganella danionis]